MDDRNKNAENLDNIKAFGVVCGTHGRIRTSGLPLRSSKNLVFNRVPVYPVMPEKPWNIKVFR